MCPFKSIVFLLCLQLGERLDALTVSVPITPKFIGSCTRDLRYLQDYGILVNQKRAFNKTKCIGYRKSNAEGYKKNLMKEFENLGKGWVGVPSSEGELSVWLDIADHYPVLVLPRKFAPIVIDKFRFKEFMVGLGYGAHIPKQYHDIGSVKYPCVVKRAARAGAGGMGVFIASDEKTLRTALGGATFDEWLVEEFIESRTEVSVNVLGVHGAIVSLEECTLIDTHHEKFIIRTFNERSLSQRYIKCSELSEWNLISDIATRIVHALNFTGFGFLQLKYDSSGHPRFVEMNGRADAWTYKNHSNFAGLMTTLYVAAVEAKLITLA